MKKQILAVATVAVLAVMSFVPAFAQESSEGSINITGGERAITPQEAISFTGFEYDGKVHDLDNNVSLTTPWAVEDLTGTGAGWSVTVVAGNFVNADLDEIDASNFQIQLLDNPLVSDDGIALAVGNPGTGRSIAPVTALSQLAYTSIDGLGVTLVTAAVDKGMGAYTLEPTFTLHVPADTYAGEYTSEVIVTIAVTP